MTPEMLNACPFCGGMPRVVTRDVEPQGDSWYSGRVAMFVLCECGACLFDEDFHEGFSSLEVAVRSWNGRRNDT